MKYNTTFFIESVVPDLVEPVCKDSWQKTLRSIMVHSDNARPHNNIKSEATLTATKDRRIPAPVYNPDPSRSDFFFFGMLKERMSETSYSSPGELITSLPKDQLVSVCKNWMKRLNWVINIGGVLPHVSKTASY
jgi:hypothetical protein